jgi:hypothetical protein
VEKKRCHLLVAEGHGVPRAESMIPDPKL